jgi:hypothetical protein
MVFHRDKQMETPDSIKQGFLHTLQHIGRVRDKVAHNNVARGNAIFTSPDQYKIAEGLYLSSWTHWEQFIRSLFILDLAQNPETLLKKEVRSFRTKKASLRLAELLLDHPDESHWIEWSELQFIIQRADTFLGNGHRYGTLSAKQEDFSKLKRIRNAIAHMSDVAWDSFTRLAQDTPFSLSPGQMRGITVGRFITTKKWDGISVLEKAILIFESTANDLVP